MNLESYFNHTRARLGRLSQPQVDGMRLIIAEARYRRMSKDQLAYVLATAEHETGAKFEAITENLNYSAEGLRKTFGNRFKGVSAEYARQPERIANRAYKNRIGNGDEASGDGWRYRGHGLVQLTGRDNFRTMGNRLGHPLEENPSLALDIEIAISIMFEGMVHGLFTGKRLGDYISPETRDFVGARRIVNGTDRADHIAALAGHHLAALKGVDMLADSRTMQEAQSISREGKVGGAVIAGGAVLDAVTETLSEPEKAAEVVSTMTLLKSVAPFLGVFVGLVAIFLIVRSNMRAKKIKEARIDDHLRGVR